MKSSRAARRARLLGTLLALWTWSSSCAKPDEQVFPKNSCSADADCWSKTSCIEPANLCALDEAVAPYRVVLQVAPAGASNAIHTVESFVLERSEDDHELELPESLSVPGAVRADSGMIPAEVVFQPIPENIGFPAASVVVTSQQAAEGESNLSVRLPPKTDFMVSIQPLGESSMLYPPVHTTFSTGETAAPFEHVYKDLERLSQQLIADELPLAGYQVRLWDSTHARVVSSIVTTEQDGSFELNVLPGIIAGDEYVLQIDVNPEDPWREVIEVPHDRIDPNVDPSERKPILVPAVPARVIFEGNVEAEDVEAPNVELTFVSRFPVPQLVGELRDRDWCRSPEIGPDHTPIVCRGTRVISAGAEGTFQVALLPGDYEVFVAPSPLSDGQQRVATTKEKLAVETQPSGGSQGPWLFSPEEATKQLTGTISNRDGTPLPSMVVRTSALSLVGVLSDVAAYNRSASTVSDDQGNFAVAVDEGYYDVFVDAPEGTGYASLCFVNRIFNPASNDITDYLKLTLEAPIVLAGTVRSGGAELADATIDAFAIVNDLRGGKRAVFIGRTRSDIIGNYVLALPAYIDDSVK